MEVDASFIVAIAYFLHSLDDVIPVLFDEVEIQEINSHVDNLPPVGCYFNVLIQLSNMYSVYLRSLVRNRPRSVMFKKVHELIQMMQVYRRNVSEIDVWQKLSQNWMDFFWMTGEIPSTLSILINNISNNQRGRRGPAPVLNYRNQVLLTMIWIRRYPSMNELAIMFGISVGYVCKIIHRIIPILHVYLVPKYIRWPEMQEWSQMSGYLAEWPRVVAILDCTPFRISRPAGTVERYWYRRDRHCVFANWIVICDLKGDIVFSRPGFHGHLHDSTCFRHIQLPNFPQGLQIMADQGFANRSPLLIPVPRQMPGRMRRSFRRCRSFIERVFGQMKSTYCIAGTKRYRGRRNLIPVICNVAAALYNRRRRIVRILRERLSS